MRRDKNRHGLSLVETLVAGVILSATVVTVSALSTRSMSGAVKNRAYEKAASLIDRQITFIDTLGIDAFVEAGQTQGEFGQTAPGYTWKASYELLGVDNLYEVTLTVSWQEGVGKKSQSVVTRFNGQSILF
ncbi:MAG: hypothetical protein HQ515_04435 [Phycisphaeraceae bacterium]|nr:hypothetical protein [Phycisphaeraceae bacterium]